MPEMDGINACKLIKQECPRTAVIALTAIEEGQSILNMINAGAIGYLTKAADLNEIIEAVRTTCMRPSRPLKRRK
jgi:DNA-binding NarL/FixJ family response regulator